MGTYSEVLFRAELVPDVPEDVVDHLMAMTGDLDWQNLGTPSPDHELFDCPRWHHLGCGGSAYYPISANRIYLDSFDARWRVFFLADLKDYSGEIRKFFDWIDPYIDAPQDAFIGYSLCEDASYEPTIYTKQGEPNYYNRNKEMVEFWKERAGLLKEAEAPF